MIANKCACSGCGACEQVCPHNCISLLEDKEGFLYPKKDLSVCVGCGLCEYVCHIKHQNAIQFPIEVYAVKHHNDEIRRDSSSGGAFSILAEKIIKKGGVVFGARFNENWELIHDYTETLEGLKNFRGAKYVQSRIGDAYIKVKEFLKLERYVLFTGTPCQVAALKRYLGKDYPRLLTVDFVCHGIPSPKIWRLYLQEKIKKLKNKIDNPALVDVKFRYKIQGWKNYSCSFIYTNKHEICCESSLYKDDVYMTAFLSNLSLRPSCYACPCKDGRSGSDIILGDFWGIEQVFPEYDDDCGVSLVLVNSSNSREFFKDQLKSTYNDALRCNPSITSSAPLPINRDFFFHDLGITNSLESTIVNVFSLKLFHRIKRFLYRLVGI